MNVARHLGLIILLVLLCPLAHAYAAEKLVGSSCSGDQNAADWDTIGYCVSGVIAPSPYLLGTTSSACSSGLTGMIRYNSGNIELCYSSAWNILTGLGYLGSSITSASPYSTGDTTTGFYTPGANTVAIAIGGQEVMRVTSTGAITIGTTTATSTMNLQGGLTVGTSGTACLRSGLCLRNSLGIGSAAAANIVLDAGSLTTSIRPPSGTTAQRPVYTSVPVGVFRYNTSSQIIEFTDGSSWQSATSAADAGITCGASGSLASQGQQILTVPSGCSVQFKVWGAAGGANYAATKSGGGGGYATITIGTSGSAVNYYMVAGGGGQQGGGNAAGNCLAQCYYSGIGYSVQGYQGGWGYGTAASAGAGGGASGVWTGSYGGTPVVVGAGGGGASTSQNGNAGGVGTQTSGTAGANATVSGTGGGGGGYSTGGAAGTATNVGGSGGSNYAASGGSTTAGSGVTPGNSGDANRPTNAGLGTTSYGNDGGVYYRTF